MVNDMTLTQRIKDWWNSPLGTVIHIEVLVVLAATIQLLLASLGSQRRQSRNFFIQKGVLGAYSVSSSLLSYIIGSMQSSPVKSNMYCILAMSLYVLSTCADSITAYSLDDHNQFTRQLAFMYDFFFTKYDVLYYGSKSSTFWSLASASLISATAFCTFPVTMSSDQDKSNFLNTRTAHATTFFTVLILACVALLELLQLLLYWMTIWGRVSFLCQYVREQAVNTGESYPMRFKEIVTKIGVFASNTNATTETCLGSSR